MSSRVAEAVNRQGIVDLNEGRATEAESQFRRLIALAGCAAGPESAPAFANLGMALRLQNRGEEALSAFSEALRRDPEQPGNVLQVFKQLQQLGRWAEALAALEDGAARLPSSAMLSEALAVALGRDGRREEAEARFRLLTPVRASAAVSYADWLEQEGRFDEARGVLRQAVRRWPGLGEAYRRLVEMGESNLDGRPIEEFVRTALLNPAVEESSKMHLAYASGRLLDRAGDAEGAMRAYDAANARAYAAYPACRTFDAERAWSEAKRICALYGPDFLAHPNGVRDSAPVFVVGMIRSGTTLLDQMLSAHPQLPGVGEGGFWSAHGDAVHARWYGGAKPSPAELRDLGERYLASVGRSSDAGRFTDKMPLNFRHLGLLRIVFPNARFIHIRRDPFDTCMSIYTTFFSGGPNFAYSAANIAEFYKIYRSMINYWRQIIPEDALIETEYETLVREPATEIARILDFLGLPWDDACLRPESNYRPITTPSRYQARQPIYQSSLNKRARYAPFAPDFAGL